jgi:chromosome segregation ATPase
MTNEANGINSPQEAEELERVRQIILGSSARQPRQAEVDRLREILFGPQMEEYARTFSDLRRQIEHLTEDVRQLQDRLGEVEKTIQRRFDALDIETRRLNDDLRREIERQRAREALLQQIASQSRQHEAAINSLGEGVSELRRVQNHHDLEIRSGRAGLAETRDLLEQRTQSLRRELRNTEDALRTELRRIADRLDNQKTDRKALASMLIEIATRLETGSTVAGLLDGLSATKEDS